MNNPINNLFSYLFAFNPTTTFPLQWAVWALILLSLGTAFYATVLIRKQHDQLLKKSLRPFPSKFLTLSFLLLINLFARLTRIEVLSMRLITWLLCAWIIFVFYQLAHQIFIKLPAQRLAHHHIQSSDATSARYHIHHNKGPKRLKKRRR